MLTEFQGELAALGAALLWAVASFVYVGLGKQMSPLVLNVTKTGIAIVLIFLTLLLQQHFPTAELRPTALLFLSGIVGIGMGDTAFFATLNDLGARRALLLQSLAPPLTALLAAIFLQEQLSLRACLGIVLTIGGVAWVIAERTPDKAGTTHGRIHLVQGVAYGFVAAFAQAGGAVLSRAALVETSVSPLWSTLIRLVGGMAVLVGILLMRRSLWQGFQPLRSSQFLAIVTATSFAGTYLGIWLQQVALKYTKAGIAQSLSATSPLFVIPLALWSGESVSPRAIFGVLIALSGVWLLFSVG